MEDKKIDCKHCGKPECYEENTGTAENPSVSYMCLGCGYMTTTLNLDNSELVRNHEETTADLIKALRWVDSDTRLVWYPTVLNFHSLGMVFPDGTSAEEWSWRAAPAVDIPEEDRKKYPYPGQEGKYYVKRVDMKQSRTFDKQDFKGACKFVNFLK